MDTDGRIIRPLKECDLSSPFSPFITRGLCTLSVALTLRSEGREFWHPKSTTLLFNQNTVTGLLAL